MSSTASSIPGDHPALTLEFELFRPVPGLCVLWMACLAATVGGSGFLSWPLRVALVVAVLLPGFALLRSQLFGVDARALKRATLLPDGQWLLVDGRGRQWAADLHAGSRSIAGLAFLRWRSSPGGQRGPWALVAGSQRNREALRRLRVRLRLAESC